MIKVGLTGGIGAGKSTVAEIFKLLGIPVFDADVAAKTLMENDANLITKVKQTFGEAAYTSAGTLNRKYLADIVFNDKNQLELLNSITHPATIHAAEVWMTQQTAPYCIKEAALLFEAGTAGHLDYIIGVEAPDVLRLQRVMNRDNMGRQAVLTRMDKQIKQSIKMRLCDFVITNNELTLIIPQVTALDEKLRSLSK